MNLSQATGLSEEELTRHAATLLEMLRQRDYKKLDLMMDMQKDDIITDLSFGRLALNIPEDHYDLLKRIYPDLCSTDATQKTQAWRKFMQADVSIPYRVNAKQSTI